MNQTLGKSALWKKSCKELLIVHPFPVFGKNSWSITWVLSLCSYLHCRHYLLRVSFWYWPWPTDYVWLCLALTCLITMYLSGSFCVWLTRTLWSQDLLFSFWYLSVFQMANDMYVYGSTCNIHSKCQINEDNEVLLINRACWPFYIICFLWQFMFKYPKKVKNYRLSFVLKNGQIIIRNKHTQMCSSYWRALNEVVINYCTIHMKTIHWF